jgi:protein-tyrosine sulfotransferase
VCPANSGAGLLARLLGRHPGIVVTADAPVGPLCGALLAFTTALPQELAKNPAASGRALIDAAMQEYAQRRGGTVWCDSSAASVDHLDAVARVFPDARYLCLHRHPMDAVAAGLEASRWGFTGYGYAEYVRARPVNTIAALAQYWTDRTSKLLDFERSGRCATHRVRYEDLASQPELVTARILRYLSLPHDQDLLASMVAGAMSTEDDPGPAASSVGRGRAVPVRGLDRGQRRSINLLLAETGYELVGEDWNSAGAADGQAHGSTGPWP